jgi:hypothetical protein
MISFRRDNDKVILDFGTDLPNNTAGTVSTVVPLSFTPGSPYIAALLMRYLSERFYAAIEKERREAYDQGWHEARGHKTKRDWFAGNL